MTGFCIDQGGIFGMRTGAAAKTEGSTSVLVNILKEQKPGESGKRSCQQSSVNDRAGWQRWSDSGFSLSDPILFL